MTDNRMRQERMRRASMWLAPLVAILLVTGTLLAPMLAFVAIPVVVVMAVQHVRAMAATTGSIAPYAALLAVDMLLLVAVVGVLLNR